MDKDVEEQLEINQMNMNIRANACFSSIVEYANKSGRNCKKLTAAYYKFVQKGAEEYSAKIEKLVNEIDTDKFDVLDAGSSYGFFSEDGLSKLKEAIEKGGDAAEKAIDNVKGKIKAAAKYKADKIRKEKIEQLYLAKDTYLKTLCISRAAFLDPTAGLLFGAQYLNTKYETFEGLPEDADQAATSQVGELTFIMKYVEGLDKDVTKAVNERLKRHGMEEPQNVYERIIKSVMERGFTEKDISKIGRELLEQDEKSSKNNEGVVEALGKNFDPNLIDEQ